MGTPPCPPPAPGCSPGWRGTAARRDTTATRRLRPAPATAARGSSWHWGHLHAATPPPHLSFGAHRGGGRCRPHPQLSSRFSFRRGAGKAPTPLSPRPPPPPPQGCTHTCRGGRCGVWHHNRRPQHPDTISLHRCWGEAPPASTLGCKGLPCTPLLSHPPVCPSPPPTRFHNHFHFPFPAWCV